MSKFFKNDSDRELWIELNAKRQIDWEKSLKYYDREARIYKPTKQALNPRSMDEALKISRNQLEYDELNREIPRYSIEEMLLHDTDGLNKLRNERHLEWCEKFENE